MKKIVNGVFVVLVLSGCVIDTDNVSFAGDFTMSLQTGSRCFTGDGLPDHGTGQFPNRGNPNAIRSQHVDVCVPANPVKSNVAKTVRGAIGIAVNGVQFRPTTAGYWDKSAPRGHSRQGDRNWSLDIFGARGQLGLDFNNAHVGRNGLYHYHGIAKSLTDTSGSSLIGYAGDGFEMHYLGGVKTSGYQLKKGMRPTSGPSGKYDGTYNEDYQHIANKNTLDECNGGLLNGKYVYFVTVTYPFVGRCLWGNISKDFANGEH